MDPDSAGSKYHRLFHKTTLYRAIYRRQNSMPTAYDSTYSNTPVHDRIPREIFEIILYLCVDSEQPVRNLANLQLVCRSWRDIILEASFLWGTITTFEGRRAFDKALRMAKKSSLDIVFFDVYLNTWSIMDQWTTLDFFTKAGEKINQWRSLEIQAGNMGEALAFIQTQNPPPNCAPINILSLGLAGLKSLILRNIPSATAADIVTILTNSPALISLRLANFVNALLREQPHTDKPNPSPIHLPFLVDLQLKDLPLPFLDFLLSNLAVPQLRSLQLIDKPSVIAQLLNLKTGNLSTTLTSVTSGTRNYEMFLYGGCKITIGGLLIQLTSEVGLRHHTMDNLGETFGRLSDHLRGLGLAELPLHLTFRSYVPVLSGLEWFTHKTNVTSLTFSCGVRRNDDLNTVMPLLGRPTSGPSPMWLLPQVEVFKIDLGTTELRRLVVDMIKERHDALPDPGVQGTVPELLREIWLYHYGDCALPSPLEEIMTEVVRAAKGADVHWEVREARNYLASVIHR
ncbi:hypothetical protein FS837_005591 [Tulasnella sp. UAMH 9824]|nr:hypothetical protein FS837_005591 [Tulasnella sp. UAMH 9824]